MSAQARYRVLFLCTHNSARSIMAEAILNTIGPPTFAAFSAGTYPTNAINPYVRALLSHDGLDTQQFAPKSWHAFSVDQAAPLDFVFTLCDTLAGESCPTWPGQPITAHWPFPDPAQATGTDAELMAFVGDLYRQIHQRLSLFVNLPIARLDRMSLQNRLQALGDDAASSNGDAGAETTGRG